MKTYRSAIIGILAAATVAVAFIQIDDTHVQTVLTGAIKTFRDAIRFQATGGGTEYVGIVGPAVVNTPSVTYKLPPNDGAAGEALLTDGSANLSWGNVVSTPLPTATPLNFGSAGDIAIFGSPELQSFAGATCPTPLAVQAINSSGALTCVSPAAGACPAGDANDIQYYAAGVCGGSSQWEFDVTGPQVTLASATANRAAMSLRDLTNSAGHGVLLEIRGAGTSQDTDLIVAFRRGVATGGVDEFMNMGLDQSNGDFNFIDNSAASDISTGTPILQFLRASGSKEIAFSPGDGTTTVPSLGVINDLGTGISKTTTGGNHSALNIIVKNRQIAQAERTASTRTRFGIIDATLWYGEQTDSVSGAGPTEITPGKTLDVITSSTGAGTAIYPGNTDIVEGQYVIMVNGGNNDLTIDTCDSGNCHVKTTGGATQTLANQYDNITFVNLSGFWVQLTPVAGP